MVVKLKFGKMVTLNVDRSEFKRRKTFSIPRGFLVTRPSSGCNTSSQIFLLPRIKLRGGKQFSRGTPYCIPEQRPVTLD